jgi:hypothetical protein
LKRTSLDRDVIVKRGTNKSVIKQLFPNIDNFDDVSILEGKEFTDKGFCATTLSGEGFSGGLDFVIKCPVGTKAAYIAEIAHNQLETEMLIQKGTTFRVLKAERVPNQYIPEEDKIKLWVEVVKQ